MPIGAVVLDIGGVLEVNPRTGWQERWAARLGLRNLEELLDPIWSDGAIGAATLGEVERRASAALHVDRAAVAEMMEDAWEEYVGTLNGERLAVAPEECVFVDDVQANVDGARAVGMSAIRFADTRQAIADIEASVRH